MKSICLRTILISIRLRLSAVPVAVPIVILASLELIASVAFAHEYTVTVDEGLSVLSVEARFDRHIDNLRARSNQAGRYISQIMDCESNTALARRDRRLLLPDGGIRCFAYRVDLERAARAERRNAALTRDNVILSPSLWLWRPPIYGDDSIDIRFELPDGMRVSAPWQTIGRTSAQASAQPTADAGHHFRLSASPRSGQGLVAFGRFDYREIPVTGAVLRVAVMRPRSGVSGERLFDWIRDTAAQITLAYGRFPNPSPQVVVLPTGRSGWNRNAAVLFGRVLRDGGESVELFVNEHRPIGEFYADWTATHEFSHLMLPYVTNRQRWISEGFAQYYQNVLMARAGTYTPQMAWQKLYEGFERGRQSRPELSPNEASSRGVGRATMKIYWSGAVLALIADVELRRRSDGRESLDDVLDRLQACCLPSARVWNGRELFVKLDTLVDEPLFLTLYESHADEQGFPDFMPILDRLGIGIERGTVAFSDDAKFADLRKAITLY